MLSYIKGFFKFNKGLEYRCQRDTNFSYFDLVITCYKTGDKLDKYTEYLWDRDYPDETYRGSLVYLRRQKFTPIQWWRINNCYQKKMPILIQKRIADCIDSQDKITMNKFYSMCNGDMLILLSDKGKYKEITEKMSVFFETGLLNNEN